MKKIHLWVILPFLFAPAVFIENDNNKTIDPAIRKDKQQYGQALKSATPAVQPLVDKVRIEKEVDKWMEKEGVLGFVENKGQMTDIYGDIVPDVLFKVSVNGLDIYITKNGITYAFFKKVKKEQETNNKKKEPENGHEQKKIEWCRMDMNLSGASIKTENVKAENPVKQGYLNFYLAHCPQGIMQVQTYRRITIREVYPGIDWVLYADEDKGLKYDFIVHPGANPENILLNYIGAGHIEEQEQGNGLKIITPLGEIKEGALLTYESNSGQEVSSGYKVNGNNVSFVVSDYDKSQALIIDPPLVWATYYGGNWLDGPRSIAVDNMGNVYASGYVQSASYPTLDPGGGAYYQGTMPGVCDGFIYKFNNSGVRLWATYYGGSSVDFLFGITTDKNDNVYIVGRTQSTDFPTYDPGGGAYYKGAIGQVDAFILKFDSAGVRLWATYYGGSGLDWCYGVASDGEGNIYIVGNTMSEDLPTKDPGGGAYFQNAKAGTGGNMDAYIVKFNASNSLVWATYYGGSLDDGGKFLTFAQYMINVVTDGKENVYVSGMTESLDFPTQDPGGGAYFQDTHGGGSTDAFILKFDTSGVRKWATYYGGSGDDYANSMSVNRAGDLYVLGKTNSDDFPTQNPEGGVYFQGVHGGGDYDIFILKFNAREARQWSTYYGGNGNDGYSDYGSTGAAITTDYFGNVYITGTTTSTDLPTKNPGGNSYFKGTYGGGDSDAFIAQFNADHLLWATYYGGNGFDWGTAITTDACGDLFITGEWSRGVATVDPGGGAYYQAANWGVDDGFFMKFEPSIDYNTNINSYTITQNISCYGANDGTAEVIPSVGGCTYLWNTVPPQTTAKATGLMPGTYIVSIIPPSYCSFVGTSDTVSIEEAKYFKADFGYETIPCTHQIQFINLSTDTTSSHWDFGDGSTSNENNPVHAFKDNEKYTVILVTQPDSVCSDTAKAVIPFENDALMDTLFIPNVFSPNGDGKNDYFEIGGAGNPCADNGFKKLTIYNRWGKKVFEAEGSGLRWDGTVNGNKLAEGVYFYVLEGEEVGRSGSVTLLR